MRISTLFPFVLSAGAVLIPLDAKDNGAVVEALPYTMQKQNIAVKCVGGCPVMLDPQGRSELPTKWTTLYPGYLNAKIEVKENTVVFNQEQIWPRTRGMHLSVKQTTHGDTYKAFEGFMPVSTSLNYKAVEVMTDSTHMMKVHPVDIEIIAVMDTVVHAETIQVKIVELEQGLALLPVTARAYVPSSYTDKCTNVWCRVTGTIAQKFDEFRSAATQKIKGWRGCGGHRSGRVHHVQGLPIKGGPAKFGPGSTLNPDNRHGHHKTLGHHRHHKHHQGGIRRFLTYAFETFIFPAVFGLSVGLIVGAVSWLFVNAIRRLRNPAQAEYIIVEQVEVEEGMAGPPKYEELYREPQAETEDEKKELLQ